MIQRAGILKSLGSLDSPIPSQTLLHIKELLALEQAFDCTFLKRHGLDLLPDKGADLEQEAEKRMDILKSFYDPVAESDAGGSYWKTVDAVQNVRNGKDPESRNQRKKIKGDSDDDEPKRKRTRVASGGVALATQVSVPEAMVDEGAVAMNAVLHQVQSLSLVYVENITLNVNTVSGKTIAKQLDVSETLTFAELIKMLPLPNVPEGECYVCFIKSENVDKVFDAAELVGRSVGNDATVTIKRERISK